MSKDGQLIEIKSSVVDTVTENRTKQENIPVKHRH